MRTLFAALAVLTVVLSGCGTQSGCVDNAGCADLQVCARPSADRPGVCTNVECVTNEQCALGNFCNEAGYFCEPGCTSDLDCRAGETCDTTTNTCNAYGCRDTNLDCGYGEFCENGSCVENGRPFCEPCLTNFDCGPGGLCVSDGVTTHCFETCNSQADCPRGYQCGEFVIDDPGTYCGADCAYINQW